MILSRFFFWARGGQIWSHFIHIDLEVTGIWKKLLGPFTKKHLMCLLSIDYNRLHIISIESRSSIQKIKELWMDIHPQKNYRPAPEKIDP